MGRCMLAAMIYRSPCFARLLQQHKDQLKIIESQATVHRCTASVDFMENTLIPYPVLENHDLIYNHAKSVAERLFGATNMRLFTPAMGAEDFSFFSQKIPAAMFMLGVGNEDEDQVHSLHSPYFFANEGSTCRCCLTCCCCNGVFGEEFSRDLTVKKRVCILL